MKLDAKIQAAVRCLQREYPNGIDQPTLDYVIGEITREHRAEFRQQSALQARRLLSALLGAANRVLDQRVAAASRAIAKFGP